MMGKGFNVTAGVSALVGILVFILIAFNLLPAILTGVVDAAGLAIVGSFSGGSALILIVGTVVIAGLILWIVSMFFPGTAASVARRVTRR